jgi:hypothetical protein
MLFSSSTGGRAHRPISASYRRQRMSLVAISLVSKTNSAGQVTYLPPEIKYGVPMPTYPNPLVLLQLQLKR